MQLLFTVYKNSGCGEAVKRLLKLNGGKIRESCLMNLEAKFNKMAASKSEMRVPPRRTVKPLVQFININL